MEHRKDRVIRLAGPICRISLVGRIAKSDEPAWLEGPKVCLHALLQVCPLTVRPPAL
jgi:hypothetical protein